MIELYSTNVTTTPNQVIAWNNKSVQRGLSATLAVDGSTIYLNSPGVYRITVSANGQTTEAGTFGFSVSGDGNVITRGNYSVTSTAGTNQAISFPLLVAVNRVFGIDERAKITITYTGSAGTLSLIDCVVEKVYAT